MPGRGKGERGFHLLGRDDERAAGQRRLERRAQSLPIDADALRVSQLPPQRARPASQAPPPDRRAGRRRAGGRRRWLAAMGRGGSVLAALPRRVRRSRGSRPWASSARLSTAPTSGVQSGSSVFGAQGVSQPGRGSLLGGAAILEDEVGEGGQLAPVAASGNRHDLARRVIHPPRAYAGRYARTAGVPETGPMAAARRPPPGAPHAGDVRAGAAAPRLGRRLFARLAPGARLPGALRRRRVLR